MISELLRQPIFKKRIKLKHYSNYYEKITKYIYPQLKTNPYFGANIRKLKGEFESVYRYRIRKIRLFYTIDKDKVIVIILNVMQRKDSYK